MSEEEEDILKSVGTKLKDAVKWSNSNIAAKQEKALRYYKREFLPGDDKIVGRSKWVSPEIAQRVDWMTASLIRIFDSPENVVEFVPFGPEDEALAKQQTAVVNHIVKTKNSHIGFLQPWLQNGLLTGLGIVTAEFTTTSQESLPRVLKGIPNEALASFTQQEDQGLIVIESASKPVMNEMGMETRDLKIRSVKRVHNFNIISIAPEDVILSKDAKFSNETGGIEARLQGHRKIVGKQALIEMGFDAEKLSRVPLASDKNDGIALERTKDLDGSQGISGDDIEVYVVYTAMKLDKKTRHYRLTLAGDLDSPVLLDHEECSRLYPYAGFVPYPIADTLFGHGIADKIGDDHVLLTKMTRSMLDSLSYSVNPLKIANPDATNLDDLLNPHPGKIVRSTDPTGGVSYTAPQFFGGQAIPVISQMSQSLDFSTGVGPQMASLNASDLQNTTATAVNARTNSGQLLVEMVSRIFADTGYRYLVRVIVDQLVQRPEEANEFISRLTNAQAIPVDEFSPDMDVATSVAFGVMSRDQSTQSLMNLLAQQMQAMQAGLPVANAQNIYATMSKLAETAGFKNSSLFFTDPSTLPPAPPPEPPQDPNAGLIAVEQAKAQLRAQSDTETRNFEAWKARLEDDRERDRMAQDFELKRAEITAKYQAQVDIARVNQEVAAQRNDVDFAIAANDQMTQAKAAQEQFLAQQRQQQEQVAAQQMQPAPTAPQMPQQGM